MSKVVQLRELLAANLPDGLVSDSEAVCVAYASDNSRLVHVPQVVVWPTNEAEVVSVVKAAACTKTPLHVRGRGTATTGASLAENGGVVMSTERMAAIKDIDVATRTATVEPGVLNGELALALEAHHLFWPPDPSSMAYCSVGGNLATAAAGPRGVRYGGVRENTLAVRAVCGDGRIITSGAKVPKSVAGYDLARLLVGSEGSLAVITEATLRLWPMPGSRAGCVVAYAETATALKAVVRLMASNLVPAAVEFLDEGCLELVRADCPDLPATAGALLLVAIDAVDAATARKDLATATAALGTDAVAVTEARPSTGLWQVRKVMSQHLRNKAACKVNEDVVVPVGELADLVEVASAAARRAGLANLNFGHAAVGNLHVNFLYEPDLPDATAKVATAVREVMEFVVAQGGSISGEHGIGIAKREYLPLQVDAVTADVMQGIKRVFDPHGILNPGKLVVAKGGPAVAG